jgi:hypothetical protein
MSKITNTPSMTITNVITYLIFTESLASLLNPFCGICAQFSKVLPEANPTIAIYSAGVVIFLQRHG